MVDGLTHSAQPWLMADTEALLVGSFQSRLEHLLATRRADLDHLTSEEVTELGAAAADTVIGKIMRDRAIGERWSTSEVTEYLGVSRQAVHKRLRCHTILGIPGRGVTWFPVWQFESGAVRPVVGELIAVFRAVEPYDPLLVASWATTVQPELGTAPSEWLEAGGDERRFVELAYRSATELAA